MRIRIQPPSKAVNCFHCLINRNRVSTRQYATTSTISTTPTPLPRPSHQIRIPARIQRTPTLQPKSLKAAPFRKTQLFRQYASIIQSSPLTLVFQHNSIKGVEWVAIRRELLKALEKVDKAQAVDGARVEDVAHATQIHVVRGSIFEAALRTVEHYKPRADMDKQHVLSKVAHKAVANKKGKSPLTPLLAGPVAILSMPTVSPAHLKAVIQILAPSSPNFPAPTRKANPAYHGIAIQNGLSKLMFLGARVEGRVFDVPGTHWIGGIAGGIGGLRSQLVHVLDSIGASLTNTLDGGARSLYFTMEGRRLDMEEKAKPQEGNPTEVTA